MTLTGGLARVTSCRNCASRSNTSTLLGKPLSIRSGVVECSSMSLIQSIQNDLTQALKSQDAMRLGTLRLIVSQVRYKEIEVQHTLTDDEVVSVIRKQVKELEEAASTYQTAGRQDLFEENVAQMGVMRQYLPAEISDDELHTLIRDYIDANKEAQSANPRAFIGKVVAALRSKAPADRIARVYQRMEI